MLVTLVKDSQSSFLGLLDAAAIQLEHELVSRAGLRSSGFSVELPYTPHSATILAPALLAWRMARPGRTVTLKLEDGSQLEIGELSVAQIEWKLPVVAEVAIVELPTP